VSPTALDNGQRAARARLAAVARPAAIIAFGLAHRVALRAAIEVFHRALGRPKQQRDPGHSLERGPTWMPR